MLKHPTTFFVDPVIKDWVISISPNSGTKCDRECTRVYHTTPPHRTRLTCLHLQCSPSRQGCNITTHVEVRGSLDVKSQASCFPNDQHSCRAPLGVPEKERCPLVSACCRSAPTWCFNLINSAVLAETIQMPSGGRLTLHWNWYRLLELPLLTSEPCKLLVKPSFKSANAPAQ
jgi:hypothetical protein